jgi:hypothetical protein
MKNKILPVWFVVSTVVGTFLDPVDDCTWWIGDRIFGTEIGGCACDAEDDNVDIQLCLLELLLFILDEYNCIKLFVLVWYTICSVKEVGDWVSKLVNKDRGRWDCWVGSVVSGKDKVCLLSRTSDFLAVICLCSCRCCFVRCLEADVQAPIVEL